MVEGVITSPCSRADAFAGDAVVILIEAAVAALLLVVAGFSTAAHLAAGFSGRAVELAGRGGYHDWLAGVRLSNLAFCSFAPVPWGDAF